MHDARAERNHALINETAFRNSSLQAAYFILAARALGLDCGPMSGFDADKLNEVPETAVYQGRAQSPERAVV